MYGLIFDFLFSCLCLCYITIKCKDTYILNKSFIDIWLFHFKFIKQLTPVLTYQSLKISSDHSNFFQIYTSYSKLRELEQIEDTYCKKRLFLRDRVELILWKDRTEISLDHYNFNNKMENRSTIYIGKSTMISCNLCRQPWSLSWWRFIKSCFHSIWWD